MTTVEVAASTGLTRQAIDWNIREGKLRATRVGAIWVIEPKDLKSFNIARYNAKRKRKRKSWRRPTRSVKRF